jgi:vacuolar protein sorting-associated protein 35
LSNEDPQKHFALLKAARAHLERGGPTRIAHTYPALIFCGLQIVRQLGRAKSAAAAEASEGEAAAAAADKDSAKEAEGGEKKAEAAADGTEAAAVAAAGAAGEGGGGGEGDVDAEQVLQWLLEVALVLADVPAPLQALRVLLACAHVTSEEAGLEMLAYEFFEQVRGGGGVQQRGGWGKLVCFFAFGCSSDGGWGCQ